MALSLVTGNNLASGLLVGKLSSTIVIMNEIVFATSNQGKVKSLKYYFAKYKVDIEVTQKPLDLIEPQADTAEEVARVKAGQAWKQLKSPVLVDDSSFHIRALKGFPGPYIKPMLETIGVDGIMQLMNGQKDRSAWFLSSLVYIDASGAEHVFADDPYEGNIAPQVSKQETTDAWSDLFKIFIPNGQMKVLSELTIDERHDVQSERVDAYEKFAKWMKSQGSS